MTDIRDTLAMLREINGTKPKNPTPTTRVASDEEILGALEGLRNFKPGE